MNLKCLLFGHEYKLKRKISDNVQELVCSKCNKEFAINHDVRCILPLDDELREAHEQLIDIYIKG